MHKKDAKSVMDTEENEWMGIGSSRSGTRSAQLDQKEETIILWSCDKKRRRLEKEIMQDTVPGIQKARETKESMDGRDGKLG